MKKALIGGGVGVLAAAALLLWMCAGGDLAPGTKVVSPTGQYVALFFGEGGGGAAGWLYEYVSVIHAKDAFDPDRHVLVMRHADQICLQWSRDNALVVHYPEHAVVMEKHDAIQLPDGRIDIDFEPVPSDEGMVRPGCSGVLASLHGPGEPWDVVTAPTP